MGESLDLSLEHFNLLPQGVRKRVVDTLSRWNRWEQAYPYLTVLAEEQAGAVYYRSRLAQAAAALGKLDEAESILQELDLDAPNSYYAIFARGCLNIARHDYPEALKCFFRLFEQRPEGPAAHWRAAEIYLKVGQLEKALSHARAAYEFYERGVARSSAERGRHPMEPPPGLVALLADIHEQSGDEVLASDLRAALRVRESAELEDLLQIISLQQPGKVRRQAYRSSTEGHLAHTRRHEQRHPTKPSEVEHPPPPPLPETARHLLKSAFSYDSFMPGQEEVIACILNKESLLVVMPTGGGKSLCYQLPALLLDGVTLIISPLIALMKDQLDALPASVRKKATLINSLLDSDEVERRLLDVARGRYRLVYAAPERLRQESFLHALARAGVSLFVVDEVHCISIWGHDFRPDYLFIPEALKRLGSPVFLGMTATAAPTMRAEIRSRIGRDLPLVSTGIFRPNLRLEVRRMRSDEEKMRELIDICASEPGPGIVYVNAREKAEELAVLLRRKRIMALHYHAGMDRAERDAAQEDFMNGRCRIVVATVAFGMGIDKSDVRFVVHYSLPRSIESYYQEAGRAGRDGKPARCVLFYAPQDKARLTRWMKEGRLSLEQIKAAYASIRRQIGSPLGQETGGPYQNSSKAGFISEDDIQRDADVDETGARIALSLLERAKLIRRHLDVPRSFTIRALAPSWEDASFIGFAEAVRLLPGQAISLGAFELAERSGCRPEQLESRLLQWRDRGLIELGTSGRSPYVEIIPARKSAVPVIREMLAAYEESCLEKIDDLIGYVSARKCRHAYIAAHFGEPPPGKCRACDICVPFAESLPNEVPQARKSIPQHAGNSSIPPVFPAAGSGGVQLGRLTKHERIILDGVRLLPFRMGKRGLVRALKGSVACPLRPHEWKYLGALDHLPSSAVEKMVDSLLDNGYLDRDGPEDRPLLALTPLGERALGITTMPSEPGRAAKGSARGGCE